MPPRLCLWGPGDSVPFFYYYVYTVPCLLHSMDPDIPVHSIRTWHIVVRTGAPTGTRAPVPRCRTSLNSSTVLARNPRGAPMCVHGSICTGRPTHGSVSFHAACTGVPRGLDHAQPVESHHRLRGERERERERGRQIFLGFWGYDRRKRPSPARDGLSWKRMSVYSIYYVNRPRRNNKASGAPSTCEPGKTPRQIRSRLFGST